jgi:hypothetical protein
MISTFLAAFRRGCCYILLVALACAPAAPVAAATFNVNSPADGNGTHDATPGDGICETVAGNGACTLRAAIEETNALAGADTINLPPNVTYTLTTSQTPGIAALEVADSLTINGSNNTIDALGAGAGVLFVKRCIRDVVASNVCTFGSPVVSISGVAFVHGKAAPIWRWRPKPGDPDAGALCRVIQQGRRHRGTSAYGGGILNGGTLTLNDCVVADNNATGPSQCLGGGIRNSGTLTVTNSVISGNSTNGPVTFGGGIENTGNLTIESTAISANTNNGTQGQGGGLAIDGGSATFRNSTISGNHSYEGGGISGGSATLIDSTVSGNLSIENGGGFYLQQTSLCTTPPSLRTWPTPLTR